MGTLLLFLVRLRNSEGIKGQQEVITYATLVRSRRTLSPLKCSFIDFPLDDDIANELGILVGGVRMPRHLRRPLELPLARRVASPVMPPLKIKHTHASASATNIALDQMERSDGSSSCTQYDWQRRIRLIKAHLRATLCTKLLMDPTVQSWTSPRRSCLCWWRDWCAKPPCRNRPV